MKKLFMEPALTVDKFASEDVIAESYDANGNWFEIGDNNDNGSDDIFSQTNV